jgi:hypothetical protein
MRRKLPVSSFPPPAAFCCRIRLLVVLSFLIVVLFLILWMFLNIIGYYGIIMTTSGDYLQGTQQEQQTIGNNLIDNYHDAKEHISSSRNDHRRNNQTVQQPRPLAILHIGPHKTGSTTLQTFTKKFVKELSQDGYEMPWVEIVGGWESQVQLATCFLKKQPPTAALVRPVPYPCDPRLVDAARKISERNRGILISSEALDRPDVNMTLLRDFLTPWDVTVVYVYRRFYSWMQSYHNQVGKTVQVLKALLANRTDYLHGNINDLFYQEFTNHSTAEYVDRFTAAWKYQRVFHNLVVLNMHGKNTDLVQDFFCKAIPHAQNTCEAVKKYRDQRMVHYNPSQLLIYYDLAYRAHRLGLIHISSQEQLDTVVQLIEQHQKVTLKLSDKDFDVICPERAMLDLLLETSLEMERTMVPEFFAGPLGESELRSDFEMQAKSSLCSVDIDGTIDSSQWKGFFTSLNDRLNAMKIRRIK